jgi:hypothetical protein
MVCLFVGVGSPSSAGAAVVIESPNGAFSGSGSLKLYAGSLNYIKCTSTVVKGGVSGDTATFTEWKPSNCNYFNSFEENKGAATVTVLTTTGATAVSTTTVNLGAFTALATFSLQGASCHLQYNVGASSLPYSNGATTNTIASAVANTPHSEYWSPFASPPPCPGIGSGSVDLTFSFPDPQFEVKDAAQAPSVVITKPASSSSKTNVTLKGTVNPNGSEATYQFEYGTTTNYGSKVPASPKSIGSGTSPIEVNEKIEGLAPETTYHFRLVAANTKGTTESPDQTFTTPSWEILSTPNPKEASDSTLYDVSCEPSTNVCTAVGKSTISGADIPVAQRWNGTSWAEQSAAKKSGAAQNRLFGVDCPSETRCLAVGSYQNSEGGPATLGEFWNEGKWNVQTTPVPSEATSSELVAIGCSWTSECGAVGSAVIKGVKTAIAERWVSPTWSLQTVPIPAGATSSQLDGIDCIWSNVCVAVGRYTTSGGSVKSLAMFWNGTEWKIQTVTDPAGAVQTTLLDVSCTPSPTRCTAVGGWKNSADEQFTLAYRFNGSTWTLQSTPSASGSTESVLQDVSCATETSCTAAGHSVGGGSTQTLAEKWNGTNWSIQGTSNPSGATFSAFSGVSCRSTTCMGVGWSTDGSSLDTTLAETR